MKKRKLVRGFRSIFALLVVAVMLLAAPAALAAEYTAAPPEGYDMSEDTIIVKSYGVMAEETTWIFAEDSNGVWWKRLWSLTYGKWLGDWIKCN